MSLFLGPVHIWLYKKIKIQNNIVNEIGEKLNLNNILSIINEKYGVLSNEPLEEIIDASNIHGWLQKKVDLVEYKLAYICKEAINKDIKNIEVIKTIFLDAGKSIEITNKDDAKVVYRAIEEAILDGMPCDRAKKIIESDENKVVWQKNRCVHTKYWEEINIDIKYYDEFIYEFMKSIVLNSNFILTKDNELFVITKG